MPPKVPGARRGEGPSHRGVTHVSRRPVRTSRTLLDYAVFGSVGKVVEATPKKISTNHDVLSTQQINVVPCKVVLKRLSVADIRQHVGGELAAVNLPSTSARRTSSRSKSSVESNVPAHRFSNVTKRTKPRRTAGEAVAQKGAAEKQRDKISIAEESHGSIITLDESTDISKVQQRNVPNRTTENGPPPVGRRTTRKRNTTSDVVELDGELQVHSSTDSSVPTKRTGRSTSKRTNVSVGETSSTVFPPKKVPEQSVPIIELSMGADEGTVEANDQPVAQISETPPVVVGPVVSKQSTSKKDISNPFQAVIVSLKRMVQPLTEVALKSLKYPELEAAQEAKRRSSVSASVRQSGEPAEKRPKNLPTIRPSRLMLFIKPQIVVSAPIAEDPEPVEPDPERPKVDANANNLLQPDVSRRRRALERKPLQPKPPSLPLLLVEEGEGKGDVYEFLSLSQTSGDGVARKKRKRPPKQKAGVKKQPVAKVVKKKLAAPKAAAPRKVGHNPFGCNAKQLARVIKQIGGGRVKSPAAGTGYVVNLELPKTPREPASAVGKPDISGGVDETNHSLPYDAPPSVPIAAPNPDVEKLKSGSALVRPQTSTSINKPTATATPQTTSTDNPASPWRFRVDDIASNSGTVVSKRSPPAPSSLVTERRKPNTVTAISPLASPAARTSGTEFPGDIVNDKKFREIERMCDELEAMSKLSENLINSLRRYNPKSPSTKEHEANLQVAYTKLRQWHERSVKLMNRSSHIINRMQRSNNNRSAATVLRPSPQSSVEQRTVNTFNNSTDRFRTMIDELQVAMNDSNVENRSPLAVAPTVAQSKPLPPVKPSPLKLTDIIVLPNRAVGAERNPLTALNFIPLPQRTSPLMSPLARTDGAGPLQKDALSLPDSGGNIRRELQYETAKEPEAIVEPPPVESGEPCETIAAELVPEVAANEPFETIATELVPEVGANEPCETIAAELVPEVGANEVVEVADETTRHDETDDDLTDKLPDDDEGSHRDSSHDTDQSVGCKDRDLFGFEDDDSAERWQVTQVTLPMPLNISAETLKRRLRRTKQFIPKLPFFRQQPNGPSGRSSGPTRFPAAHLRVFSSPTKRPYTLREFIASTPRIGTAGSGPTSIAQPLEAPDVSAIENHDTVVEARADQSSAAAPEVVLFDTPEESRVNRSVHQQTYARIPKRRKKINIYLANLGLEDDDGEEDEDNPVELSSDSESEGTKQRKKKAAAKKKVRRKPKPVEETKEFKEFVDEFNSMCEQVNRFEVIIE